VRIEGRIQGVWFRDSCCHVAIERDVRGWIRNRPDGGVEAVFEGPADGVEAMLAWCRSGPPLARVARVEVTREVPEGIQGFDIRGEQGG
jgi:acylphosphatase